MPVYQVDYQSRYPWPENPDGYYYWTNTFYTVAATDNIAAVNLNGIIVNMYGICCTTGVETPYYQIKTPPGRQAALYVDPLGSIHGLLTETEPGLLTSCVRIYGYIGGKVRWWKMWRVPLQKSMTDGLRLTDTFHSYLEDNWGPLAAAEIITTADGDVVEEFHASPLIHMWQQRHGTKRRQRVVFAVP